MGLFSNIFGASTATNLQPGFIMRAVNGPKTDSGASVSEFNAVKLPAVYACVGLIADAIAELPVKVCQQMPDGSTRVVTDHPAHYLLNVRPNDRMTAFSYRSTSLHHALLWGNGYSEIEHNNAHTPQSLWLALPDRTWPELLEDGSLKYHTTINHETRVKDPADMLHVPAMSFDGVIGYSQVAVARQAIGLGMAMEEFAAKFFGNDMKSGGFIEHPGKLSEKAKANISDSMSEQGGNENFHRVKVLEEGAKFHQTTIPPEDAQFLESQDFQVAQIARMYRIPLHMIQSVSGSTSWGSGLEEMSLGFVRYTLGPWMVRTEQEWGSKLLTEEEIRQGYYIKHDTRELTRGDAEGRSSYYQKALHPQTGWLLRSEVRDEEDRNPVTQDEWLADHPNEPVAQNNRTTEE